MRTDDAWLSTLGPEMGRHREAIAAFAQLCADNRAVSSFSVGCSIGRGAGDALSDIDAAVGVSTVRGTAGAADVQDVEAWLLEALPALGEVVDVLRTGSDNNDFVIRQVFVQFSDRLQLDLAVIAEGEVRRGEAAPDFVPVFWREGAPNSTAGRSAHEVSPEQIREWAFLGWRALLDADKYLRRGSVWEAHQRVQDARDRIWMLWAAARGAAYPWHGLSQALDDSPDLLPPNIETTVAGLDAEDLRRAVVAAAQVLADSSAAAGTAWNAKLPSALADHTRRTLMDWPPSAR
ncbi:hypothetical protein [Leekyejoonella antrihumi]|uniref:Nucleotidyltransferase domain-containing protein n=1 Tax=Leekyejoonella antrihumi TaxID=1660198 RepID=A0A563E921_9MICO|nr:hypothetical protein [Leekyejoonella antrihumi]TWP39068.1 hypothetical protein FGL98_01390 [Leekyejoonella antrihumi]